uniref:Zona pellucida glycoprotein 1 n=1 Tax=Aotus nancymaae TaxID=37293 RepID=A0A2K5D3X2_AOTNA
MAGRASAATWGYRVALLLLVTTLGLGRQLQPDPGLPQARPDSPAGIIGMTSPCTLQHTWPLLFPTADEFGNRFDVNNCPICYHWVTTRPQEPAVFSADYRGCHVLEKDGHFHLRVFMEAVLPNGRVDVAQDATLICPKPVHSWTLDSQLAPPAMFSVLTPQTLPFCPTSGHTSPGSGHAFPSPLDPGHSSAHPTPALPFPGPGPALKTLAQPHWGPMEHWDVNKSDYVGTHLSQEQCQVASGYLPCLVRGTSKEARQQAGCCYDNTTEVPCYYGNTATVQRFRGGCFILVVSQEIALTHRITLANVHLAYIPTSCSPTQDTDAFVVFQFLLTNCGTTVQVGVGTTAISSHRWLATSNHIRKGPQGSIKRDSTFQLHVCCVFNASDFLPVQASIFPPPLPAPVTQPGPLRLELWIAKGMLCYPCALQAPASLTHSPPWLAAPRTSPHGGPWPILSEGCPFEGDSYGTQMVALDRATPFQSHYQQFTVATFALLDSGSQRTRKYASACHTSGLKTCSTACRPGTASHRNDTARPQDMVSSPGPAGFEDSYGQEPIDSSGNSSLRPLLWVVLSLPAVSLVLGFGVFVGLSQKLWESN